MSIRKDILFAVAMAGITTVGFSASADAGRHAPRAESACMIEFTSTTWYFSGTARYIDDYTGKEDYMTISGFVDADSREEAMEMAKESGRAQAARRGRVVSVNIRVLWD